MSRPFECDVCGTTARTYKLPRDWGTGPWERDWGFMHTCDDPICKEQMRMHEQEYVRQVKELRVETLKQTKPPRKSTTILPPKYKIPVDEFTLELA